MQSAQHIVNRPHVVRGCERCTIARVNRASVAGPTQRSQKAAASLMAALTLLTSSGMAFPEASQAVLSSPLAKIARSADSALRRSIPALNPNLKKVQAMLEDVQYQIRIPQRKSYGNMMSILDKVSGMLGKEELYLASTPVGREAEVTALLADLKLSIQFAKEGLQIKDADKGLTGVATGLANIAEIQIIQAPTLSFRIPAKYESQPRLTGRAAVRLTFVDKKGEPLFQDYEDDSGVVITIDGYSAPLSSGRFLANLTDGLYNGVSVLADQQSVYFAMPPNAIPDARQAEFNKELPNEMEPLGAFEPVYGSTLDVVQSELPVLPLSIDGAVTMGHGVDSATQSTKDWFIFKYDKASAGLSGMAFDEGTFSVLGYVTKGLSNFNRLQRGDKLASVEVLYGADRLVR